MMYTDDPFLRNKPFVDFQRKSNLIANATNLLNNTNKYTNDASRQDKTYITSQSSATINKNTNQDERSFYPPALVSKIESHQSREPKQIITDTYDSNLYLLNQRPPKQRQENIGRSIIPSKYPENKFTYLHDKYADNYRPDAYETIQNQQDNYQNNQNNNYQTNQNNYNNDLMQRAQKFSERNKALFLGINQNRYNDREKTEQDMNSYKDPEVPQQIRYKDPQLIQKNRYNDSPITQSNRYNDPQKSYQSKYNEPHKSQQIMNRYDDYQSILRPEMQQRQQSLNKYDEPKLNSEQRQKLGQESNIFKLQVPSKIKFNPPIDHRQKQYTANQDCSFERFLPDDILD